MTTTPQTTFEQALDLIDTKPEGWRTELSGLLAMAHKTHATLYREQWIPRLKAFKCWDEPLCDVSSIKNLTRWIAIAPFAHFKLTLGSKRLTPKAVTELLESPQMKAVSALSMAGCSLGRKALDAFSSATWPKSLKHLDLSGMALQPDATGPLVNNPRFRSLVSLDISSNTLCDIGVHHIAHAKMPRLRRLNISYNAFGAWGAEALASARWLSKLTHLNVSMNQTNINFDTNEVGVSIAAWLADAKHAKSLTHLNLAGTEITAADAKKLAASPHMSSLRHLDLSYNDIESEGAKALAISKHITALNTLSLSHGNYIRDDGAVALAASPNMASLTHLDLSNHNAIGDDGAIAIANSPHFASLDTLTLKQANKIKAKGARALARSPHLKEAITAEWAKKKKR